MVPSFLIQTFLWQIRWDFVIIFGFAVVYVWDKKKYMLYFLANLYLVYIEAGNPVGKIKNIRKS